MITSAFENLLRSVSPDFITELFIYFVLVIFVLAVIFSVANKTKAFVQHAPSLMTSVGILGTFLGIIIGLLNFDTSNIDGSIPELLAGLKMAFVTSVVGLVAAISFNIINSIFIAPFHNRNKISAPKAVGPKEIYQTLEGSRSSLTELKAGMIGDEEGSLVGQLKLLRLDFADSAKQYQTLQSIENLLQKTNESLSGNEDGSLVGQLKLIRYETEERSTLFEKRLFSQLKDFSEMLSKSASEQIIDALKNVIVDFNSKLTEQFGDNFKALDASVQKLVVWQQQYKEQIDVMSEQYSQSVDSLMESKTAVSGIWQECQNIPLAMEQLRAVVEVNQHQIAELGRHLEAFVNLRDAAIEAVPTIHAQLDIVGGQLSTAATDLQTRLGDVSTELLNNANEMKVSLTEGAEGFRNSINVTQQSFSEMSSTVSDSAEVISETFGMAAQEFTKSMTLTIEDLGAVGKTLSSDMSSVTKEFDEMRSNTVSAIQAYAEQVTRELGSSLEQAHQAFNQSLDASSQSTGKTMNAQLEQLEMSTAREIETAMQAMANSLVQITDRFVKDYEMMVKAMERVISHSNKL